MSKRFNKKRMVEIYFILYLTAMVFLLPDRTNNNGFSTDQKSFSGQEFALELDKSILTCKLRRDSSGLKILYIDSVNSIYVKGDAKDVIYDVLIEDQAKKLKYGLNNSNKYQSKFFKVVENTELKTLYFYWMPPTNEIYNKTYLVKIRAKIYKEGIAQGLSEEINAQFALNTVFDNDDAIAQSLINQNIQSNQSLTNSQTLPNQEIQTSQNNNVFEIVPNNFKLQTLAASKWTNFISVSGLNPRFELASKPEVQILNEDKSQNASVYLSNIVDNGFLLEGRSPNYAEVRIRVSATRKSDKTISSTEFVVKSTLLSPPVFDREMYPEITYKISPKLPIVNNQSSKALIKDSYNTRASSYGQDFTFTPQINDTGKIVYLERYVGEDLIGEKYPIVIKNYPYPDIYEISVQKDNSVLVKTRSFGTWKGNDNVVSKPIISIGNVRINEKFGSTRKEGINIYQVWEISSSNSIVPSFKVRVMDARGFYSAERNYIAK